MKDLNATDLLAELQSLGNANYKKVMLTHGAREPFYGVKVEDLKKIVKRVQKNCPLALDLYATGVGDAMYLAALIADDARMTRADLNGWVEKAYFPLLSPSPAQPRPLRHEWICDRHRFLRSGPDGARAKDSRSDGQGLGGHGWHLLQSSGRGRVDPEGAIGKKRRSAKC